jgi:hypothetical protein
MAAARAVHMGLGRGDDRDRRARRRRCRCVGVTVAGFMAMVVIVTMAVVMAMAVTAGRIGAAFGLEGVLGFGHGQVHGAQHVGQHVVGLDLQVIGLQLDGHVSVAQVVGGAGQVKGGAVLGAGGDHQHRLRRGEHAHQRAVLGHQHVAAAHHGAARQKDAEFAPGAVGGGEAAFLAHVPVELDRGGAFEQRAGQAAPL